MSNAKKTERRNQLSVGAPVIVRDFEGNIMRSDAIQVIRRRRKMAVSQNGAAVARPVPSIL